MYKISTLFILSFIFFSYDLSNISASEKKIGIIGSLNQSTDIKRNNTQEVDIKIGSDIYSNDLIATDSNGNTQLLFLDRSALTVGPNSSLVIDKFIYDPNKEDGELTIDTTKGAFRFIGGALSKKKAVKIKTPVSTIGIRGGIAYIDIDPETGATDAIFIYGEEMRIENKSGDVETTNIAGSYISVESTNTPPTPATLISPEILSEKLNILEPKSGTNGGAVKIPTKENIILDRNISSLEELRNKNIESNENIDFREFEGAFKTDSANIDKSYDNSNYVIDNELDERELERIRLEEEQALKDSNQDIIIEEEEEDNIDLSSYELRGVSVDYEFQVLGSNLRKIAANISENNTLNIIDIEDSDFNFSFELEDNKQYGNITSDNEVYSIDYYRFNEHAYYIHMNHKYSEGQITMFLGDPIGSGNLPNGDLSYYEFTPDNNLYHTGSNENIGFFDYNIIDDNLLSTLGISGSNLEGSGLFIDWKNKKLITGYTDWNYNDISDFNYNFKIAIGNIEDTDPENIKFDGIIIEVAGDNINNTRANDGFIKVNQSDIFGDSDRNTIDGFILNGIIPNSSFSGDDPFAEDVSGRRIQQNLIKNESLPLVAINNGTNETLNGFIGGFMILDAEGAATTRSVGNVSISDFEIVKSITGNNKNIRASLTVRDLDDPIDSTKVINSRFGYYSGVTDSSNADVFINDNIYAIQQINQVYDPGASNVIADDADNGVLVSSYIANNDSSLQCSDCQFVDWGIWAANVIKNEDNDEYDVSVIIPYIAGNPTVDIANITGLPTIQNYSGITIGSILDNSNGNIAQASGTFTAIVNFGTREIDDFDINHFGGYTVNDITSSVAVPISTGTNTAATFEVQGFTGPGYTDVDLRGSFFGPQADDIGGNFKFTNTTDNITATGVFLGSQD